MNFVKARIIALMLLAALAPAAAQNVPSADLARLLGISFPSDSQSTVLLTRDGKQYAIDVSAKTVREVQSQSSVAPAPVAPVPAAALFTENCARCHGADGKGIKSAGT